jgi:hypothetical protein
LHWACALFAGSTVRGAMDLSARPTPAATVGDYALPPLPDSVPSQIGWLRVTVIPDLTCDGVEVYGCFEPQAYVIKIRAGMHPAVAWQTLEHERMHVVFFNANLHFPPGLEDHIADVIASGRVLEMRQTGR